MLQVRHLSKYFSSIPAIEDVSFSAGSGQITGYLGANGSGKSTTFKIVTGLLEPTSGEVLFEGIRVDKDWQGFRRRFGYVPEEPHLYLHLTGSEYLDMVARLRELPGRQRRERVDGLLHLFGLHGNRNLGMQSYSKGMRQKVLLSAALMHNPDLVLLDEPFAGLDVSTALILRSLIQELATRGKVVLFSSHELDTVERLCVRVVILHRGRLVADDRVESLRDALALPSLERVFTELASEQSSGVVSRDIADLIGG